MYLFPFSNFSERILRVKFISGVFEHPFSDQSLLDIVGCKVTCARVCGCRGTCVEGPPALGARREGQGRGGRGAAVVAAGRRDLQRDVDVGADFRRFHREKAAASRATPTLDATASSRDQSL